MATTRGPGRMAPHVDGFKVWLLDRGYTPGTVEQMLKFVRELGRWMAAADVRPVQLNQAAIEAFLRRRMTERSTAPPLGRHRFDPLLTFLEGEGVLRREEPPATALDDLVADYRSWLVDDRGLAEQTIIRYERTARRFLGRQQAESGIDYLRVLAGRHVVSFLLADTARVSVGSAKGRVAELRSLLRFLYLRKLVALPLAAAVPPVAGWRDTSLPAAPGACDVQRLIDSCDRSSPGGIRDRAVLLLLARLGLRSVEVARLTLDDLNWRTGEITVRGKARRHDRLPLPWEVGEALGEYLQRGRPSAPTRRVFLALKAPRRPILPAVVGQVTHRACERAGLHPVGAHRLRHGFATELLRRGATLVQVSQLLRHQDLATTAVYAKVDLVRLRHVAQPWPGAQR